MQNPIAYCRVVDLTHAIRPGIPLWPGDPPVGFETVADIAWDGYFLRRLSMGEHSGTHLSTPSSTQTGGVGPDQIPVENLVVSAVVIDISGHAMQDPDYALRPHDVSDWEQRHGTIPAGSIVLLATGWDRYWGEPRRFINSDRRGVMHFPGFGSDAARLLLEDRGAAGLGTDTHGIDPGADAKLSITRLALARNALVLECLNRLRELPPTGSTIVIGRLPLVGGSGSPASVLALAP